MRLPLGLFRGGHPAGTAVPCVKSLPRKCPWRIASPLVTPKWPQEGLSRSRRPDFPHRGRLADESVGTADWRALATRSPA